ncbi:endolytic transglycosylase MltG [Candidatus Roizmanbacteria bacterium]|nr:endolytic transglycosylase MltG [Candidatus Roizmanbacteria bacterium]
MKKRVLVFLIILVVLIGGTVLWFREATLPVNTVDPVSDIFVIQPGEGVRTIANNLENEGFIRDSLAFFILVKQQGIERNIQAGDFRLSTAMSAQEIIEELQHGTIDVWVTIPEGWRNEEIALKLTQELAIPEQEFLLHAEEGYMFPDTYLFPKLASGSAVAAKMRNTFTQKVAEDHASEIAASEFTLAEIVTLASLVERESRFDEERPIVASVLINRIHEGMSLNIDATLQYALGYQSDEKDWWKQTLTIDDKEIESPYNTYKYAGLPPGPIANPGLSSILAVLNPSETNYFYYLHDADGQIHLAETYEEHQQNIERYLR